MSKKNYVVQNPTELVVVREKTPRTNPTNIMAEVTPQKVFSTIKDNLAPAAATIAGGVVGDRLADFVASKISNASAQKAARAGIPLLLGAMVTLLGGGSQIVMFSGVGAFGAGVQNLIKGFAPDIGQKIGLNDAYYPYYRYNQGYALSDGIEPMAQEPMYLPMPDPIYAGHDTWSTSTQSGNLEDAPVAYDDMFNHHYGNAW